LYILYDYFEFTNIDSSQLTTSIHWPCYCTAHMYVFIQYLWSYVVFLCGSEFMQVYLSFVFVGIAVGDPVIKSVV